MPRKSVPGSVYPRNWPAIAQTVKQIGNAVPVNLAKALCTALLRQKGAR